MQRRKRARFAEDDLVPDDFSPGSLERVFVSRLGRGVGKLPKPGTCCHEQAKRAVSKNPINDHAGLSVRIHPLLLRSEAQSNNRLA